MSQILEPILQNSMPVEISLKPEVEKHEPLRRTSILSRLSDFWFLGGASILLCLVVHLVSRFKYDISILEIRFYQIIPLFSVLSIFCNHPHFMISYRFGYGRGWKFILKNWFALMFVPLALLGSYSIAYSLFQMNITESPFVLMINSVFEFIGLSFRLGTASILGKEIVGLTIWLMYFTVG